MSTLLAAIRAATLQQLDVEFSQPEDGPYANLKVRVKRWMPNRKIRAREYILTDRQVQESGAPDEVVANTLRGLVDEVMV